MIEHIIIGILIVCALIIIISASVLFSFVVYKIIKEWKK